MAIQDAPNQMKPVKPVIKIKNYVRRHTSPVDLTTLQGKGFKKLNLITLSKINKLITLAVESTFEKFSHSLNEVDARRIEEEVQKELGRRLREPGRQDPKSVGEAAAPAAPKSESPKPAKISGRTVGHPESAVEHGPVGSVAPPRLQIQPPRGAGQDRTEPSRGADASPDGLADLETAVRGLIARVLEEEFDRLRPTADIGRESRALDFKIELDRIIAASTVDPDTGRLPQIVNQISNQRTDLLERRLEKLKNELLEMEVAMERLAAQNQNPGLASIFREIQGLNQLDKGYAKKKGLLQCIFESNLKLQFRSTSGSTGPGPPDRNEARHGT